MSNIKKVKAENLDFERISNTAGGAANNDFLNENSILKEYWGDENEEVDFVLRDDGTYLIEQNGIAMGFTDEQGYENAVNMKLGPDQKDVMARNVINNTKISNNSSNSNTNNGYENMPNGKMKPSYIDKPFDNILHNDRAKQWGLGQEIEFEFNGHKAHGHKYADSSTTIFYFDEGKKIWNRYDKSGNLTDIRIDDGKNQTITYYNNGEVVKVETI